MGTVDSSVDYNSLGDLDYLFDDLDANCHFEEERGGCVIEYHSVYDTKQKTEVSVGLTSEFISGAVCADGPTEPDHPALGQQRSNTRQRGTRSSYNTLNIKDISDESQVLRRYPSTAAVRAKSRTRATVRVCSTTANQNGLSQGLQTAVKV
jgi:hypothetical protein